MTSDMNAIMVGYLGMQDMLSGIFGKGELKGELKDHPPVPKPDGVVPITQENWNQVPVEKLPKLTAANFDRMFDGIKGKPN